MDRLMTPDEIERAITEVDAALQDFTDSYAVIADEAANAEADYRLRYFGTIVRLKDAGQKMTDKEAEARATLHAASELRLYKISGARLDAAKQALQSYRARLDALRTLAASARVAVGQN